MSPSNSVKKITISLNPKVLADAHILAALEVLKGEHTQVIKVLAAHAIAHMPETQGILTRAIEICKSAKGSKGKGFNLAVTNGGGAPPENVNQSAAITPVLKQETPFLQTVGSPVDQVQMPTVPPADSVQISQSSSPVDDLSNF